jgi:hypothetical protein
MKNVKLFLIFLTFSTQIQAQVLPQKEITPAFSNAHSNDSLLLNKQIDTTFKQQIIAALLFYPELKNIKIKFKIKKTISPLAARPRVWAIFQKPKNREYLVIISSATIHKLEPILLKNLSFNAQVGVLGHEISHILEYNQKKGGFFLKLLCWQLSKKKMDIFENNTDRRTIEHGLGYQLKAWSTEVRQNLKIEQWNGANTEGGGVERERYMSPQTIEKIMKSLNLYTIPSRTKQ